MPKLDQFAVILFTLRDHLKTRQDALATFDRVAEIGYQAVQISGMDQTLFPPGELREILAARGLAIAATHEPSEALLADPQSIVDRLKALGCTYTAYPFPAGIDFGSEESVAKLIRDLNAAGKLLAENGQVLTYHNHAHEFYKSGGRPLLERIYAETDPAYLQAELDVHWVQRGGGNPVEWVKKMAGRQPLIHLKDYKVDRHGEAQFAELGNGTLPLPEIVQAAEAGGCRWYIVEQDVCPGSPFDSIAASFAYIKANLAG
jgi:sugar phosphate isomerase/epimerase